MTPDEIKQLRDLADRAAPGPWETETDDDGDGIVYADDANYTTVTHARRLNDAEYLAALSPERIKELCDLAADGAAYRARCALAELEDKFTEWLGAQSDGGDAALSRLRGLVCIWCGGRPGCHCENDE